MKRMYYAIQKQVPKFDDRPRSVFRNREDKPGGGCFRRADVTVIKPDTLYTKGRADWLRGRVAATDTKVLTLSDGGAYRQV